MSRNQDPGFRKRLDREIELYIRETRDGCPGCLAAPPGRTCPKHDDLWAVGVQCEPRQHLELSSRSGTMIEPQGE